MRRENEGKSVKKISISTSFKTGIIALVFLIIGFEAASFIDKLLTWTAVQESETQSSAMPERDSTAKVETPRHHTRPRQFLPQNKPSVTRRPEPQCESFEFNPNTVNLEELQRLGFSQKQAQAIINYRQKGGRFNRKSDFARSFVVSDTIYKRLEPYIQIPLLDINKADSSAFDALPGIGPYFAAKMVEYRKRLKGYSYKEQLMDIWNFDREKYEGLEDLIMVGPHKSFAVWSLPEDSLRLHPYIGDYGAHGIVIYRENTPPQEWSVRNLADAGVLKREEAAKLERCLLE